MSRTRHGTGGERTPRVPARTAVADPCTFLEWDSSFFGRRIAAVTEPPRDLNQLREIESWCRTERIDCLYCLVPADAWPVSRLVEGHGFRLVDVRVTHAWPAVDLPATAPASVGADRRVRLAVQDDVARLCAIARVNHRMITRFYNDPGFPTARCDALYETWIRQSCEGDAEAVFVCESGGAPAGYLTCHLDAPRRGRIGLVALTPEGRGQGLDIAWCGRRSGGSSSRASRP